MAAETFESPGDANELVDSDPAPYQLLIQELQHSTSSMDERVTILTDDIARLSRLFDRLHTKIIRDRQFADDHADRARTFVTAVQLAANNFLTF
jgi:hypothetical protein